MAISPVVRVALAVALTLPVLPVRGDDPTPASKSAEQTSGAPSASGSEKDELAEWRLFRGDRAFHGFRDLAVAKEPKLAWRYDTRTPIEGSPTVAGGLICVGTEEGKLLALDLRPRKDEPSVRWTYETEGGIRSSPSWRNGRVYFGDMFGVFHCVSAETGKREWIYDTKGAEIIASANFYRDASGEERVIVGTYDGLLWSLDAETGGEVWKFEAGGPIHASPAVSEGVTCIAGCDESVRVIDLQTGKEKIGFPMGAYTPASPVFDGTKVYVGTHGGEVLGFDWKAGERLWAYRDPKRSFPFSSSAALSGDRLVLGGEDKLVHCIDRRTGEKVWTFPTRAKIEASPVIAGTRVFIGSGDKNFYLLDLASGEEVWRYEGESAFVGSPALADGRLVVTSREGMILCFDVKPR